MEGKNCKKMILTFGISLELLFAIVQPDNHQVKSRNVHPAET